MLSENADLAIADFANFVTVGGHTITVNDLPPDVTATIAEVAQTTDGIHVKFRSKT